ncbi:MAG: ATP-binding protein [Chloroflexi bacterium]|nr:ATP-binding protein [Chloroflexota bacterium]
MNAAPVGITKGPGLNPNEYIFISRDSAQNLRHGEFVYYHVQEHEQERLVLGRITHRELAKSLPDGLLAEPSISPRDMADLLGYESSVFDLFYITVSVLGYYDPVLGFVNPRIPPASGGPIFIADNKLLRDTLCRVPLNTTGAVHIGSLLSRQDNRVPVVLDARGFTSTHLAIIASTGAGKSYLAGVIIEELMKPNNRAAVLVVDPHAEYDTLTEMQNLDVFVQEEYRPRVRIFRPKDIKVRISSLELGDLRYLLPNLSEKMHYALGQAYNRVKREYGERWTLSQLLVAIRAGESEHPVTDPHADEQDPTINALVWRVNSVLKSPIFDDYANLALRDLCTPGQCTILQLNEIPEREQQVIVATLLRRLNQARMDTVRQRAQAESESYLPYPVFVLIEEAHNFAPANAEIITSQVLKQILSEGRKFGIAVGLISQRPGKLDGDVLSQCMTQCIMRIVNPVDQSRIAESVETVGRDLLTELPALSKGQAIIAGASVNTPVLVRVRSRLTPHGAPDPDAPSQWRSYLAGAHDEPLPPPSTTSGAYSVFRSQDPF